VLLVALGLSLSACVGQPVIGDGFYNQRHYGLHRALDINNGLGSKVIAMSDGVVSGAEKDAGPHTRKYGTGRYGRVVQITSGDLVITLNHTTPAVEVGDIVRRGDVIGYTDLSGVNRYGQVGAGHPHVHIQLTQGNQFGERLDPQRYIVGCYEQSVKYSPTHLTYPVECTND
jgi:murein DD-endopeptidase MepM/ murein hydrolase activator NlpD